MKLVYDKFRNFCNIFILSLCFTFLKTWYHSLLIFRLSQHWILCCFIQVPLLLDLVSKLLFLTSCTFTQTLAWFFEPSENQVCICQKSFLRWVLRFVLIVPNERHNLRKNWMQYHATYQWTFSRRGSRAVRTWMKSFFPH